MRFRDDDLQEIAFEGYTLQSAIFEVGHDRPTDEVPGFGI